MKKLTAKRPILYGGRMYEAGDVLPAQDQRMVTAWLEAGSAEVIGSDAAAVPTPPAGADSGQNDTSTAKVTEDTQDTENAAEAAENGETDTEDGADTVEGHQPTAKGTAVGTTAENMAAVDPAQLEDMTKEQLKQLADDMGVEIPRGATKALIVERLAAATVKAPVDNGGGAL